jgi:hypothetical protein
VRERVESAPQNTVPVLAVEWRASATGDAGDPNVKTPMIDESML